MYTISLKYKQLYTLFTTKLNSPLSDECLGPITRSARLRNTLKNTVRARSSRSLTRTVRCVQLSH